MMKIIVAVVAVLMSMVLFGCQNSIVETALEAELTDTEVIVEESSVYTVEVEDDSRLDNAAGAEPYMETMDAQEDGIDVFLDESAVYTKEQLTDAVYLIADTFENEFSQCTLLEIEYDEEYSTSMEEMNTEMFEIDNAVVFTSTFAVADDYVSGPLNPGEVYEGYEWMLTMDADGNWNLVTCGYQ